MVIVRKRHPIAFATATVIVQFDIGSNGKSAPDALEQALDKANVARRTKSATSEKTSDVTELRCEVEYGPDRGTEGTLRRHLLRHAGIIGAELGADDCDVMMLTYRPLADGDRDKMIRELEAQIQDINVPMAKRKQTRDIRDRLKRMGPD